MLDDINVVPPASKNFGDKICDLSLKKTVEATTESFSAVFETAPWSLAIDTYQRGFVWGEEKIRQLINDLTEFCKMPAEAPAYYMGTLLLHEDEKTKKCFVIDGQQRLTALCVLHHHAKSKLPDKAAMAYRTVDSAQNIRRAQQHFQSAKYAWPENLFDRICFTVIKVPTEDLAFTFFDTQNNRGVRLGATDLLKAFHLRAITEPGQKILQTDCAQRWERMQETKPILLGTKEDFAPSLFNEFLWRARCWVGKNVAFESHDALLQEFQIRTRKANPDPATVPLYRSHHNLRAATLSLLEKGAYELATHPIKVSHNTGELAFAIRQPLSRGVGFFLFTDKYAALTHEVMNPKHPNYEVRAFHTFYQAVIANLSVYLREAFLLAVLMYVDQFAYVRLLEFALRLDHVLGGLRISKAYVFQQTAKNFFRDKPLNLLDVIAGAFDPEEVMDYLKQDYEADKQYAESKVVDEEGVQGRYIASVLTYYERQGSLKDKQAWINDEWITQCLQEEAKR